MLFGHSYAGSTDGGGDDFVQRGVADHDFMQSFGRIAPTMSSWATVTRWDTPWPMAAMPAMASPVHTTFTNPPEAPAACAMGFRVRGTCDTLTDFPGGKEPFGGLADAHDLGAAVNAGRDRAGHVYAFFVSEDAAGDIRA